MLADSIIGKMYIFWLESAVYGFFHRLALPFGRAWPDSFFARFLKRKGRLNRYYDSSLTAGILRGISGFCAKLSERVKTGSKFYGRYLASSVFLSYGFLLGFFVFLMFAAPHSMWNNIYALIGAVFFMAPLALTPAGGPRRAVGAEKFGLPFALFVLACLLSLLFTTDLSDSVRILSFFITAFMLMLASSSAATDKKTVMRFMGCIYFAVLFSGMYAFVQRIAGIAVDELLTDVSINTGVPGRVFSTLGNPNNYAEFLVLFLPLCAVWAVHVRNRPLRLALCLGLAVPALALVMTYSRSGWLSMVLAAAVFVFFADRKVIPLLFFACVAAFPFLPDSVMIRLSTIFNAGDTSAAHRIYVWKGVALMLSDRWQWLTGIGLGPETFANVYPEYARRWAQDGVFHSQMLYLDLIIETGALGFVSFMWMMARSTRDACVSLVRAKDTLYKGILIAGVSSFAGMALAGTVEYIWFYPRVLFAFFILLGIFAGALDTSQESTVENLERQKNQ